MKMVCEVVDTMVLDSTLQGKAANLLLTHENRWHVDCLGKVGGECGCIVAEPVKCRSDFDVPQQGRIDMVGRSHYMDSRAPRKLC